MYIEIRVQYHNGKHIVSASRHDGPLVDKIFFRKEEFYSDKNSTKKYSVGIRHD